MKGDKDGEQRICEQLEVILYRLNLQGPKALRASDQGEHNDGDYASLLGYIHTCVWIEGTFVC